MFGKEIEQGIGLFLSIIGCMSLRSITLEKVGMGAGNDMAKIFCISPLQCLAKPLQLLFAYRAISRIIHDKQILLALVAILTQQILGQIHDGNDDIAGLENAFYGGVYVGHGLYRLGNQNFLHPEFWKELIEKVNGTVTECNTAYEGTRNTTEKHLKTLEEHGWSKYFPVDLLDAEGPDMVLEIPEGK